MTIATVAVIDNFSTLLSSLSNVETVWLVGALMVAGVVAGLLAGMLGIGGGGILVPVLFEAFGFLGIDDSVRMHLAVGTSLAVIVPTSIRSFTAHRSRGTVDMPVLRQMAALVILGVLFGSIVAKFASSEALRIIWVVVAILLGLKLALGREDWRLGDHLPGAFWIRGYGLFLGVLSTLMGIGGGIFMVTFMTLFNRPLLQAVSTSSGLGLLISIPGVLGLIWAGWSATGLPFGSLGYVSLLGAAVILPASMLVAPLGVRIAHGVNMRTLELVYAVFLVVVSVRFLISLMN
ncbi:MAG: sulfite exporter TauE/SafE family protein [Hyphomicrobiaceae bacterium]